MKDRQPEEKVDDARPGDRSTDNTQVVDELPPREIGGREGPDPTRYGDWEKNGRCIDF